PDVASVALIVGVCCVVQAVRSSVAYFSGTDNRGGRGVHPLVSVGPVVESDFRRVKRVIRAAAAVIVEDDLIALAFIIDGGRGRGAGGVEPDYRRLQRVITAAPVVKRDAYHLARGVICRGVCINEDWINDVGAVVHDGQQL